jgi:hypothetical protein
MPSQRLPLKSRFPSAKRLSPSGILNLQLKSSSQVIAAVSPPPVFPRQDTDKSVPFDAKTQTLSK